MRAGRWSDKHTIKIKSWRFLFIFLLAFIFVSIGVSVYRFLSEKEMEELDTAVLREPLVVHDDTKVDEKIVYVPTRGTKFLNIIIPTISRDQLPPEVDYLTPTVDHLMKQLSTTEGDHLSVPHQIQIFLINHNLATVPHLHFEALKKKYNNSTIEFVSSSPKSRAADKNDRIYQQTVDFLWSIKYVLEFNKKNPARYTLLMEDDFTLCPNGMLAIQYLIAKSSDYYPDWVSLRVSYGLNGVIIKTSEIPNIIAYYERAVQHKRVAHPPDHMIYYYAIEQLKSNDARKLVAFRYNLFSHIGDVSTFTGRKKRYNPNCYQVLYDWLQEGERFHNEHCPLDDISPCSPKSDAARTKWSHLMIFNADDSKLYQTSPESFPLCSGTVVSPLEASKLKCRIQAKK